MQPESPRALLDALARLDGPLAELADAPGPRGGVGEHRVGDQQDEGDQQGLDTGRREALLDHDGGPDRLSEHLHRLDEVTLHLPFEVADYIDFYCSLDHATNVGRIFRPDAEPLLPNWRHLPVGYHGRAGTVVVSGTDVVRPLGQRKSPDAAEPDFGPSTRLDIEAELGFVVVDPPSGPGTLYVGGIAATAGQVVTAAQISAGAVTYAPNANDHGNGYAALTFSVRDSDGGFDVCTIIFNRFKSAITQIVTGQQLIPFAPRAGAEEAAPLGTASSAASRADAGV